MKNQKIWKRALALTMAGIVGFTSLGLAVHAEEESEKGTGIEKEETVYIVTSALGAPEKIIVSDWMKNSEKADVIQDVSLLTDVVNVKGDETFTQADDQKMTWNAAGQDIYYQGQIDQPLPVDVKISYFLDGKEISPEELAGKSGRVTIRFDYENHQYEMRKIGEKQEKIYVPFIMLTGTILDSRDFTNVTISNGKLIHDGERTIAVGFALPGMKENLKLEKLDVEIPESVEITADVTNFHLGMTMTIATNEIFSHLDRDKLSMKGSLDESMTELSEAMTQLLDGSSALADGLSELLTKSGELVKGINQAADGTAVLKAGGSKLSEGANQLQSGAYNLSAGLNQITANNAALTGGAQQVFHSLLNMANQQIAAAGLSAPTLTIENYAGVLSSVIASLDSTAVYNQALAQVTAAVEASRPVIVQAVTEAVRTQVEEQVILAVTQQVNEQVRAAFQAQVEEAVIQNALGMSAADYQLAVEKGMIEEEVQQTIASAILDQMGCDENLAALQSAQAAQMESEEVQGLIQSQVEGQMATEEIQGKIAENVELQVQKTIAEQMASEEVQSRLTAASEGAQSLIALKASLDSYQSFYLGVISYTSSVSTAAAGAAQLSSGAGSLVSGVNDLNAGLSSLYTGMKTMKENGPVLMEGITQLSDGAAQMASGLVTFDQEGVSRIVDAVSTNLAGITERLQNVIEVSRNYKNYSGICQGMEGTVKFIYRTEEIKA